jgi:hypothetical protein
MGYLLLSLSAHIGLLLGIDAFWLPRSKMIPIEPLSYVTMVLEEENVPAG